MQRFKRKVFSNEDFNNDMMKIVKSFEESGLLIKSFSEPIENKTSK